MKSNVRVAILGFMITLLFSCSQLKGPFKKLPPYESYLRSLDEASLSHTRVGQTWIEAGESALKDSLHVKLPFSETGYFTEYEPMARSYGFDVGAGQVLTIQGKTKSDGRLFMDVFLWEEDHWEKIAYNDSALSLTREFKEKRRCLVRLQPELLVNVYYAFSMALTPGLINPVSGASNKSIGSVYGDPRDGGQRSHEGVDIFAKRGTPVIAPTDGRITRVGLNHLGGKVVWMHDNERDHNYYFAHLDSQWVSPGTFVHQGDTLGQVGNTGNARTTPPHLHFGIYQRGSKDPLNYVKTLEAAIPVQLDTAFAPMEYHVTARLLNLRAGPDTQEPVFAQLENNEYVRITARTSSWARLLLPDGRQGYASAKFLTPVKEGMKLAITGTMELLSDPATGAVPLEILTADSTLSALATFGSYRRVRTGGGLHGWVEINP